MTYTSKSYHGDQIVPKNFPPTKGLIVTLMGNALLGGENMPMVNPAGRDVTYPADLFEFTAFDQKIEFRPVIAKLVELLARTSENIESQLTARINEAVLAKEGTLEQLSAHLGGGFVVMMEIDF